MRSANTILELIRERGKRGWPLEGVYKLLFNKNLYLMAYGKMYRNKGAMTHGVTDETPDGMSRKKIDAIIEALRNGRYQWLPARRTYIPKKNGKKRPLGMPVWSDTLVQEVIRLLLEAYYEPHFYERSHGFRPGRGCHTVLREIHYQWTGMSWLIEGDISQCFDKLSHELVLQELSKNIHEKLITESLRHRKRGNTEKAEALRKQAQAMPSKDVNDPTYRRLKYARYADDFLLGFNGPRSEAEEIKQQLRMFLQEDRKRSMTINGTDRRSINGRIGLQVPKDVIEAQCQNYKRNGKAIHRAELLQESDYAIVTRYQSEYRGIANYYRLAYNMHTLKKLKWVMEISLTKTLASKHKTPVSKVYEKYRAELVREGKKYKGLQVLLPRQDKKPLVATWGGVSLAWDIKATLDEQPPKIWTKQAELVERLLADFCELCGSTEDVEVHHIRAMKHLHQHPGREKPEWVKRMIAMRRKTMPVYRTCHVESKKTVPR